MFEGEFVSESSIGTVVARMNRIIEIQKLLVDQIRVLETMSPMDFLEFRDLLSPSSGFQSVQFRLIENKLGLEKNKRVKIGKQSYTEHLSKADQNIAKKSESSASLFELVEQWLEQTFSVLVLIILHIQLVLVIQQLLVRLLLVRLKFLRWVFVSIRCL